MESQRNEQAQRRRTQGGPATNDAPASSTGVPSVESLTTLRGHLEQRQQAAIDQVGSLIHEQRDLTLAIAGDITAMRQAGDTLQHLERQEHEETGFLGSLTRRLGRRSRMLERRTVAARLHDQYAELHTTLRKASAFADELRLCSAELAGEVDHLHAEVESSLAASAEADVRLAAIEAELAPLEASNDPMARRKVDRLVFERADLRTASRLFEAKAHLCDRELEPVRNLWKTVHGLHEEMAHYVLNASSSIEGSGRKIQALGLAADAPLVVAELQAGLDQLDLAMNVTEAYLEQAQDLLTRVLPDLSEQVKLQNTRAGIDLEEGLKAIEEARADDATDADLRAAAVAEVELLGLGLSPDDVS